MRADGAEAAPVLPAPAEPHCQQELTSGTRRPSQVAVLACWHLPIFFEEVIFKTKTT